MALQFRYLQEFKVFRKDQTSLQEQAVLAKTRRLIHHEIRRARKQGVDETELVSDLVEKIAELHVLGYLGNEFAHQIITDGKLTIGNA